MNNFKGDARRTFNKLLEIANNSVELISAYQCICIYFSTDIKEKPGDKLSRLRAKTDKSTKDLELISILTKFVDQWEIHA